MKLSIYCKLDIYQYIIELQDEDDAATVTASSSMIETIINIY